MNSGGLGTFLKRAEAFSGPRMRPTPVLRWPPAGGCFASLDGMSAEIALGRAMAVFAHPFLAWGVLSARGRLCLTGAYLAAGYVAVLATLLLAG